MEWKTSQIEEVIIRERWVEGEKESGGRRRERWRRRERGRRREKGEKDTEREKEREGGEGDREGEGERGRRRDLKEDREGRKREGLIESGNVKKIFGGNK